MNKRFIKILDNKIIGIRFGPKIVDGEIESEIGEYGQIKKDGKWINDPLEEQEKEYFKHRQIALTELNLIKENILLGEKTEQDLLDRQKQWFDLKAERGWS